MSVFVHAQGIKTVHPGRVKKWQNSVHVVVECPQTEFSKFKKLGDFLKVLLAISEYLNFRIQTFRDFTLDSCQSFFCTSHFDPVFIYEQCTAVDI